MIAYFVRCTFFADVDINFLLSKSEKFAHPKLETQIAFSSQAKPSVMFFQLSIHFCQGGANRREYELVTEAHA